MAGLVSVALSALDGKWAASLCLALAAACGVVVVASAMRYDPGTLNPTASDFGFAQGLAGFACAIFLFATWAVWEPASVSVLEALSVAILGATALCFVFMGVKAFIAGVARVELEQPTRDDTRVMIGRRPEIEGLFSRPIAAKRDGSEVHLYECRLRGTRALYSLAASQVRVDGSATGKQKLTRTLLLGDEGPTAITAVPIWEIERFLDADLDPGPTLGQATPSG